MDIINYNHNIPRYDDNWVETYTLYFDENALPSDNATYSSVEDYYTKKIEPNKINQVYSNNTFAIKLNLVIKNYFKSIFK